MNTSPHPRGCRMPIRRAGRCSAISLFVLLAAPAVVAAGSTPMCAGAFTLESELRNFDGSTFTAVVFKSPALTLITDTFGMWAPVTDEPGPYGFMLRHRRIQEVRVGFCALVKSNTTPDRKAWVRYVDQVRAQLGESTVVSEQTDSTQGPPAVGMFGWPTREALFVYQAMIGGEPLAERHVLASGKDGGVLFVLSGPLAKVASASQDFRFFLTRLEEMPAP
jgi:hypothetical protein